MGVIFGSAVIGFFAGLFGLRKLEKKKAEKVLARFKDKQVYGVSSNVNFFGQQSLGAAQIRGNGVLILVEGQLFFQMWAPQKELSIKFADIKGVETPKLFLGKSKNKPLLKVLFKNEKRELDSAAWFVKKLSHWQAAIEKIAKTN